MYLYGVGLERHERPSDYEFLQEQPKINSLRLKTVN